MTVDLVEFLRARLDEDEEKAKQVEPNQSPTELRAMVARDGGQPFLVIDSARVLREVEAKRRIVALHSDLRGGDPSCSSIDYPENVEDCETLRLLAAVYADHPDYRQEWRP